MVTNISCSQFLKDCLTHWLRGTTHASCSSADNTEWSGMFDYYLQTQAERPSYQMNLWHHGLTQVQNKVKNINGVIIFPTIKTFDHSHN